MSDVLGAAHDFILSARFGAGIVVDLFGVLTTPYKAVLDERARRREGIRRKVRETKKHRRGVERPATKRARNDVDS